MKLNQSPALLRWVCVSRVLCVVLGAITTGSCQSRNSSSTGTVNFQSYSNIDGLNGSRPGAQFGSSGFYPPLNGSGNTSGSGANSSQGKPAPSPRPGATAIPSAKPGATSIPPLPAGKNWVSRNGSQLFLNGAPFVPVGPNIFWLALDGDTGAPPSNQRVREAFAIAQAMGSNTVRSHTLGVSTAYDGQYAVLTGEGQYNEGRFKSIDYAIYQARLFNQHLIIPLTDNYHYYHGGKWDFLYFAGVVNLNFMQNTLGYGTGHYSQGQLFYSNPRVVSDFENYISHWLNHVNPYTQLAYKDDSTIMAWELGNELGAWSLGSNYSISDPPPPASWARQIAQYIKSIDPQHLVVDAPDGVQSSDLSISEIDIYSRHPYGVQNVVSSEAAAVKAANKVYLIGEYDAHDNLNSFLQTLSSLGVGGIWWSLEGHNDDCSGYMVHNDQVSMTYPGLYSGEPQDFLALANFGLRFTGQSLISSLPSISCSP